MGNAPAIIEATMVDHENVTIRSSGGTSPNSEVIAFGQFPATTTYQAKLDRSTSARQCQPLAPQPDRMRVRLDHLVAVVRVQTDQIVRPHPPQRSIRAAVVCPVIRCSDRRGNRMTNSLHFFVLLPGPHRGGPSEKKRGEVRRSPGKWSGKCSGEVDRACDPSASELLDGSLSD